MNEIHLSEYGSAVLLATLEAPNIRPGGRYIDRFRRIKWEDATEEQRKNLTWIRFGLNGPKTAHLPLTPEEKEEIKLNEQYHKEQVCKYLLEHFNIEFAKQYAKTNNVNIDLNVPYCLHDNQCNLFCPFYEGRCMKGENDEN